MKENQYLCNHTNVQQENRFLQKRIVNSEEVALKMFCLELRTVKHNLIPLLLDLLTEKYKRNP